jgi:hypothetical protein
MSNAEPVLTGRQLALRLNRSFPDSDWIASLAKRAGQSRDTVEWHLQEDMLPPQPIAEAAAALLERASPFEQAAKPGDAMTKDDLPFSGIPKFLGKLHKD